VQHAPINSSFIKIIFVLWEANVIQPPWKEQTTAYLFQTDSQCRRSFTPETTSLTGHPVVVQLALQILFLWPESLQGELQFLPVERLLHAYLLRRKTGQLSVIFKIDLLKEKCISLRYFRNNFWLKPNNLTHYCFTSYIASILSTDVMQTFSKSCCDACSKVCPDLIQFWLWAAYNPRPCSWSHAQTSSLLHRENGTSTALKTTIFL